MVTKNFFYKIFFHFFYENFFYKFFYRNFFVQKCCHFLIDRPLFIVLVLRYLLAKCVGGLSNAKPSYTFEHFLPLKFFSEIFVSDHIFRKIYMKYFLFGVKCFQKLLKSFF